MNCVLTKGRTEPLCRNNIGGIKYIYFFSFVEYADSLIEGTKGVEITSFPNVTLYRYEPNNANFSETITNDENGVKYSQNLTLTLAKQDLSTTRELNRLQSLDLRYIVQYNTGKFRMAGVYNGSSVSNFTIDSGGSKGSLNGYNVTISGDEEYAAPFLDNLEVIESYLLNTDGFYLLLEDSDKIIL